MIHSRLVGYSKLQLALLHQGLESRIKSIHCHSLCNKKKFELRRHNSKDLQIGGALQDGIKILRN